MASKNARQIRDYPLCFFVSLCVRGFVVVVMLSWSCVCFAFLRSCVFVFLYSDVFCVCVFAYLCCFLCSVFLRFHGVCT